MADAMQGIMSLPEAGAMPGADAPRMMAPEETNQVFDTIRSQMGPVEFEDELLTAGEEADPAALSEFRDALLQADLSDQEIDDLGQVVDIILADPSQYPTIREDLLSDGIEPDLLPETFDPAFFGALNIALDQISATREERPLLGELTADQGPPVMGGGMPPEPMAMGSPMAMAAGGLASISNMGRYGDRMLAHVTPSEARMLRRRGGSGTINPATGLPEFFLKKLFKGIGKALKKIGTAVKKFVKSPVGRVIATVALGYFAGPMAAQALGLAKGSLAATAVSGFVGGFGSTLLGGGKFKDALKVGATSALVAGAGAAVMGGLPGAGAQVTTGAPGTAAVTAPPAPGFGEGLGIEQLGVPTEAAAAAAPSVTGGPAVVQPPAALTPSPVDVYRMPPPSIEQVPVPQGTSTLQGDLMLAEGMAPTEIPTPGAAAPTRVPQFSQADINYLSRPSDFNPPPYALTENFASRAGPRYDAAFAAPSMAQASAAGAPSMVQAPVVSPVSPLAGVDPGLRSGIAQQFGAPPSAFGGSGGIPEVGAGAAPQPNALSQFYQDYIRPFTPSGVEESGTLKAEQAYADTLARTGSKTLAEKAYTDALPGALAKYGPTIAAGLGVAGAAGAFSQPTTAGGPPVKYGTDLYYEDPSRYRATPGGAGTVFSPFGQGPSFQPVAMPPPIVGPSGVAQSYPINMGTVERRTYTPESVMQEIMRGGFYPIGRKDGGTVDYPRKNGAINGPGTGTSDSIPAMLSDGEFVFTAKAVRNMGNGSRRMGAKRMYALMKSLENKTPSSKA